MKKITSLFLVVIMLMSTLLLSSCGVWEVIDFIFNNGHEHSWHDWTFKYTNTDVQVVCVCEETVATYPVSKGLDIQDGVLLGLGSCTDSMVVVPDGVTIIGAEAFKDNYTITGILLPNSLTYIGLGAFENCAELQLINIPEGVSSIEKNAFKNCTKLYGVLLPESLAYMGAECFADCPLYITLYYRGNNDGWNDVNKNDGWDNNTDHDDPNYKNWGKNCSHQWGERIDITEENCFNPGESIQICEKCGKVKRIEFTPQHTSAPDAEWETYIEPTCISVGYEYKKCLCGETGSKWRMVNRLDHNIETTVEGDTVTVFCHDCNKVMLTCPYVEGSKGVDITNGVVTSFYGCNDKNIVIPSYYDGYAVTSIAWDAASNNDKIESVVIPDSVVLIGSSAFANCNNLKKVVMGKNVTHLDNNVFYWCDKLESVTLSDSLESIGELCFAYCKSLKSVEIPDSLTYVGDRAFEETSSLQYNKYENGLYLGNSENPYVLLAGLQNRDGTSLEIHKDTKLLVHHNGFPLDQALNLKNISVSEGNEFFKVIDGVLYSKDGKTLIRYPAAKEDDKYVVPDGVVELAKGAFDDAENLKKVVLPDSLKIIGDEALSGTGIVNIDVPYGVEVIGDRAFYACQSLESITLPETVKIIDDWAFGVCYHLKSIPIPQSVEIIGSSIYTSLGDQFVSVEYAGTQKQWYDISRSYNWDLSMENYLVRFTDGAFTSGHTHKFDDLIIKVPSETEEGIKEKRCECGYIEYETIPMNYYSEGLVFTLSDDGTCYEVTSVGSCEESIVTIPPVYRGLPVTSIGDSAFEECNFITTVGLPDSLISIGKDAFSWCPLLESISIPDSVTYIGDKAFCYCTSLKTVTLSNSLESIGSGAFSFCESLETITIPDSVVSFGAGAFSPCNSLKYNEYNNAYYLGNDDNPYMILVEILDKNIMSYIIPDTTEFIDSSAFDNCKMLKGVSIPDSVTSIGMRAFSNCTALEIITIPDSVITIGYGAFEDCTSLKTITIPDSVINIGTQAFKNCYFLSEVILGDSIEVIGSGAFLSCYSLKSITIPDSVTQIDDQAFSGCRSLTEVNFENTNGWLRVVDPTTTIGTSISSADLENPATAAEYLTSTYVSDYWRRTE